MQITILFSVIINVLQINMPYCYTSTMQWDTLPPEEIRV